MTSWAAAKRDVLESVVGEILHNYGKGRVVVAVDAGSPVEAVRFAGELVEVLHTPGHGAFLARASAFELPHAEQERLAEAAGRIDIYRQRYDYSVLRRVLLDPFRLGGSTGFVLAAYDPERDAPLSPRWVTGAKDAVLVVAGEFLHRPELRGGWNHSIWLDDGRTPVEPEYRTELDPRAQATAIVDVSDPDQPRRVFADSC